MKVTIAEFTVEHDIFAHLITNWLKSCRIKHGLITLIGATEESILDGEKCETSDDRIIITLSSIRLVPMSLRKLQVCKRLAFESQKLIIRLLIQVLALSL